MNAVRIPTPAQNAWAVNDARRYAAVQATRFDLRNRTPIFTCDSPATPDEERHLTWPALIVASLVGLAIWIAAGYAAWWAVGVYVAMQGVK
jgi:hypothetical protein